MKNSIVRDLAVRFSENPLVRPTDITSNVEGMNIVGVLNPAVFKFQKKTWLLIRVVQRPDQTEDSLTIPVSDRFGEFQNLMFLNSDPKLEVLDSRVVNYDGKNYRTTHSHFRLMCSDDGRSFYEPEGYDPIFGDRALEAYGIEDGRVTEIEGIYYLTYSMVSASGVGVGLMQTRDWKRFEHKGMILPPHNQHCAIFEEKIRGRYYALHRPSSNELGGEFIWLAESLDTIHWGNHTCLAKTRENMWDSASIGAGCAPIETPQGWLVIYHGADADRRYCLGALLLSSSEPWRVIARSESPIMEPTESYEMNEISGSMILSNGHLVVGDKLLLYYGACDETICGAELSIHEILTTLSTVTR